MKRVLFTVALCVVASASFAQKKAVTQAQSIAKGDNANFEEARALIQGALTDPETKDDPKTWYVAGFVEDQQFSQERTKQMLGQEPNEAIMYEALMGVLPYFEKAYELDQLPNEKGKVKPRYVKDIKGTLSANHIYYINGGAYYFEQNDYPKAYEAFNQYLQISDLPMFKGEATAARDSNFMTVQFYAAVAATQLGKPEVAIAALERAKAFDFRGSDIYQYLAYEYEQVGDSVGLERTLKEGLTKYPDESYFLLSLINNYIYADRNEEAIQYINTAIAQDGRNPQLYDVMGRVYESGLKDYESAEKYFKQALEIDPEYIDAMSNLGRVYFNQGVTTRDKASDIRDNKLYQEEVEKAKEYFRQAMPYFEKVHQARPDEREPKVALTSIYYSLDMGDKLAEMEAKMSSDY